MWKWPKIALINLAVLAGLMLALNGIAAVALDLRSLVDSLYERADPRAQAPSFSDKEGAQAALAETQNAAFRYAPYLGWTTRPFEGRTLTVDATGERVHGARKGPPARSIRIFGGSAVFGIGVDDGATFPALLDALLPEHDVRNHGQPGYVSRQDLAMLINIVNQEEPIDTVIFYDGVNDVSMLCRAEVSINGHQEEAKMRTRVAKVSWMGRMFYGALLELFRRLTRSSALHESRCEEDPAYAEKVADTMIRNWLIAHEVVTESGGTFFAILQPVAYIGRPHAGYIRLTDFSRRRFGILYPLMQKKIRERGLPWMVDMTDVFDGDRPVYFDGVHVNEEGNRMVAERIAALLR